MLVSYFLNIVWLVTLCVCCLVLTKHITFKLWEAEGFSVYFFKTSYARCYDRNKVQNFKPNETKVHQRAYTVHPTARPVIECPELVVYVRNRTYVTISVRIYKCYCIGNSSASPPRLMYMSLTSPPPCLHVKCYIHCGHSSPN